MTELDKKKYPNIGQSFGILGIIILVTILTSVLFLFEKFIDFEILKLIYYLFAFGFSFWIIHSIRKRTTGDSTFNFKIENPRIIPFIVITSIALLFGVISPIVGLIPIPEFFKNIFFNIAKESGFFSFLLMIIAAPILEELIFRGIVLDGLLRKYSPTISILISSTQFGLVHLNPWQFVTAFVIGVFAGWIYYKSKSLSLVIIIHATVNMIGYLTRYFSYPDSSSMNEPLSEIDGSVLNLILTIVISILVIIACIYYLNNEFKKKKS